MSRDILIKIYHELRLPTGGSFPRREYHKTTALVYGDSQHVVPPLDFEVLEVGWWEILKEREISNSGIFLLPRFTSRDELPEELHVGDSFNYGPDRVLSMLEKCRVVSKVVEWEERLATEETTELLHLYLQKLLKPVYTYYVLEEYPPWTSYFHWITPHA